MKANGFLETGTSLINLGFVAMARTIGVHAMRVEDAGELKADVVGILRDFYLCPPGAEPWAYLRDCSRASNLLSRSRSILFSRH
jgi:hypothetical protein